ncbi:Protein sel-1 1 [Sphaceloma murrayae]|uniref:Protein sel-1 1 n=1 Tax=Sphaceloma murrayae TaxID=2082308 RepID=A0A2K1QFW1_9PEZI|nr:Protein sel-1 1 [Sphaceloma murrayae]
MGRGESIVAEPTTYRDSEAQESLLAPSEKATPDGFESDRSRESPSPAFVPWLLCLALSVALGVTILRSSRQCDRQDFWRPHELIPATRDLPDTLHDVQFDAILRYNESHKLYRVITDPPFVGRPSPEIDAAWKDMMGSIDVFVTPKERQEMGIDLWLDPETELHVGMLSVMHDLHCVNMIRKSLSPDYYPEMQHYTTQNHIEHCLDALRLSLMCTGDMTLIPTKDSDSRPFEAVFDTAHSCRDFSAIKRWSKERDSATLSKYQANAEALKEKGPWQI